MQPSCANVHKGCTQYFSVIHTHTPSIPQPPFFPDLQMANTPTVQFCFLSLQLCTKCFGETLVWPAHSEMKINILWSHMLVFKNGSIPSESCGVLDNSLKKDVLLCSINHCISPNAKSPLNL